MIHACHSSNSKNPYCTQLWQQTCFYYWVFSLILNNPKPIKVHLPYFTGAFKHVFAKVQKRFYAIPCACVPKFVSFYFWLSHLFFHRLFQVQVQNTYICNKSAVPFFLLWLLQNIQAVLWRTMPMVPHAAPHQPFKGKAHFNTFPGLPHALCLVCFVHSLFLSQFL